MTEDNIAAALAAERLSVGAYYAGMLDDKDFDWFSWYQEGIRVAISATMQMKVNERLAWLVQRINENGFTARRGGVQSAFWLDHGAERVRVFYTPGSTYDHFDFLCQSFPWDSGYVSQFTGGCVSLDADPRDVAENPR